MKKSNFTLEANPKEWLAERLSNKNEQVRRTALEEVEKLGPGGIEIVLGVVRDEAAKLRKQRTCKNWGVGIYLSIIGVLFSVWIVRGIVTHEWSDFPGEFFQSFTYFGIFGAYAVSTSLKEGTTWLAKFQDPRLVGPLVDTLETGDKDLKKVAEIALVGLLPTLTPETALSITSGQRAVLRKHLTEKNKKLATAILLSLRTLSDTAAIPAVEALIERSQKGPKPDQELFETAFETFKYLESQKELEKDRETLLRPADSAPETLLRPSISASETDPAALLRPVNF